MVLASHHEHIEVYLLYGVYFFQSGIFEQTEPSNAEDCVKYVYHVPRSISKSTQFRVLFLLAVQILLTLDNLTWHCRINCVNFSPSIQWSLFSMAILLMTHQL